MQEDCSAKIANEASVIDAASFASPTRFACEEFPMNASQALTPNVEPWLRGTHSDVPAVARAVQHALELAAEDIAKWTYGLTEAEVHTQPLGLPSVAFHMRHIARSVDRILTYAEGGQLTPEQLRALKSEQAETELLADLLEEVERSFSDATARVRQLAGAGFETFRGVGRKQLPTSIGGALVHVADHTQRHTGQVVTTAKVLKALRT
jgi:uncharacterized damage-inducible protein DinB